MSDDPQQVLNLVLSHQSPDVVARLCAYWQKISPERMLLVYGGSKEHFQHIAHSPKLLVDDPRLKTRDHQRELQSYSAVYRAVSNWLTGREFTHIYFAEFDHLPLVDDLNARQLRLASEEQADVLGHSAVQLQQTSHPHYLYHLGIPEFARYWPSISRRSDPRVVLSMFGSGSFWTRAAFDAVAQHDEPFPMYLEIYLPTLAHHLGFRVRDFGPQNRFIKNLGDLADQIEPARAAGAWTVHPVKRFFENTL